MSTEINPPWQSPTVRVGPQRDPPIAGASMAGAPERMVHQGTSNRHTRQNDWQSLSHGPHGQSFVQNATEQRFDVTQNARARDVLDARRTGGKTLCRSGHAHSWRMAQRAHIRVISHLLSGITTTTTILRVPKEGTLFLRLVSI